jgi:hypothetical protein
MSYRRTDAACLSACSIISLSSNHMANKFGKGRKKTSIVCGIIDLQANTFNILRSYSSEYLITTMVVLF